MKSDYRLKRNINLLAHIPKRVTTSHMPKGRILAAAGSLILLAGFCAFFLVPSGPPEPAYQGKPLSDWITCITLTNGPLVLPTAAQREMAADAMHHIGTNAIPFLIEWVSYDPWGRRNKLRRTLQALPARLRRSAFFERLFVDPNKAQRADQAAAALICLGPEASPAFPELGRMLTDADVFGAGSTALHILTEIGEPAVPTLIYAMTNKPSRMREFIVINLGDRGPKALAVVPALKCLLQDPEQTGLSNTYVAAIEKITGKPYTNVPLSRAGP